MQLVKSWGRPSRACDWVLKTVIESESIVKVGCGIDDDLLTLYRAWGMNLQGPNRFDLGGIVSGEHAIIPSNNGNKNSNNLCSSKDDDDNHHHLLHRNQEQLSGLKSVTAKVLGLDLSKSKRDSRSNWGRVPLKPRQVVYAARDAWAAAAVADCLALVDPDLFAADSLIRRWQEGDNKLGQRQLPLDHLLMRAERRRWAKEMIRQFRSRGEMVAELKEILKDTAVVVPERIELASYFVLMPAAAANSDENIGFSTHTDSYKGWLNQTSIPIKSFPETA